MSKKKRTATTEEKRQPAVADSWAEERPGPDEGESDATAAEIVGLYQEIAVEVAEAGRLAEAVEHIVKRFCDFGSFEVGYGLVDPEDDEGAEVWWASDDDRFARLREELQRDGLRKAGKRSRKASAKISERETTSLTERALAGLPVLVNDLEKEALSEAEAAIEAGLGAAYAFPVFFGSEVVAVLVFFSEDKARLPDVVTEVVQFALRQLEVLTGTERAERAVRAAARHARAQASELNEMAVRLHESGAQGGEGMYDALTGFPRKRLLLDRLQQSLRRRQRNPNLQFAVACVGLEGLGPIRDRLGLRASEEFLLALCRRMEAAVRPADTVARTGEDEFTVILEDTDGLADANAAAERIQTAIKRPYRLDGEEAQASASVGLALSSPPYEYAETILRDATAALRASRAFGDEQPRVFDLAEQPRQTRSRPEEEDLELAIRDGQMALEHRPIVSLETGRIAGFEAHVRWHHPERGPLTPEQFLPESGVGPAVSALLSWSLREACLQVLEWERRSQQGRPYAALVLSSEQFYSPDLVTEAWDVLTSTDLDGSLLRFVVGEGALTQSPGQAAQVLASLGALEVGVVMEGFGTGYSSLPHLHRLRPRGLMIDRAFLTGVSGRPAQWLVARTIVELARVLDAEAIASGIETAEQLERLFQLGCRYAQGPFFGGALPLEQTEALLQEGFAAEVRELRELPGSGDRDSPFTRYLDGRR
jgi:diguanylate cyclase (GGDEF)-like protein